jgi:hypothetical protein
MKKTHSSFNALLFQRLATSVLNSIVVRFTEGAPKEIQHNVVNYQNTNSFEFNTRTSNTLFQQALKQEATYCIDRAARGDFICRKHSGKTSHTMLGL